jgi:hypothetical protein
LHPLPSLDRATCACSIPFGPSPPPFPALLPSACGPSSGLRENIESELTNIESALTPLLSFLSTLTSSHTHTLPLTPPALSPSHSPLADGTDAALPVPHVTGQEASGPQELPVHPTSPVHPTPGRRSVPELPPISYLAVFFLNVLLVGIILSCTCVGVRRAILCVVFIGMECRRIFSAEPSRGCDPIPPPSRPPHPTPVSPDLLRPSPGHGSGPTARWFRLPPLAPSRRSLSESASPSTPLLPRRRTRSLYTRTRRVVMEAKRRISIQVASISLP